MSKNLSDVSNQDLMSELKRRTTIDDAEIKKFSTLNSQLESKDKALTQFLASQKATNLDELDRKIKGLETEITELKKKTMGGFSLNDTEKQLLVYSNWEN